MRVLLSQLPPPQHCLLLLLRLELTPPLEAMLIEYIAEALQQLVRLPSPCSPLRRR